MQVGFKGTVIVSRDCYNQHIKNDPDIDRGTHLGSGNTISIILHPNDRRLEDTVVKKLNAKKENFVHLVDNKNNKIGSDFPFLQEVADSAHDNGFLA